ncbi:MAG: insulinase family protein [Collinsella intestinalis]|uniref:Insulinase family protein n=1 Tax=Collinsella intestinalis TaxID=147207 RepID=A0A943BP36_9ACTN|nr:insulinase family protein [Collinsella intestinalis]
MNQPTPVRERAATTLPLGSTVFGFTVTSKKTLAELDADAYVLHHRASGARLLYLACEDENKAFSIAFKTPPTDDTGVFHILEHSVLCGSTKFPVKEPFVDLIKSSMQTFLNAMTYPDKTVYPVASTNEQDLLNLMDVYMDAVLNPAIYTKRAIFEQEGWHYELDVPEGAPLAAGTLRYNGVVFNEMKGALSDPMSVLDDAVNRALFPDTTYACESGGDPRAIPQLTYEQFLDTHARHYNLANSYIVLYGDMEVERELAFLDERYLGDGPRLRDEAKRARALQTARDDEADATSDSHSTDCAAAIGGPNPLVRQNPLVCDYERVEMATTPDNALVGMAYVIGDAADRKRLVAADVLIDALMGTNEAPVKKAILAAGLGGNVVSYTSGDLLQPHTLIILQNAKPEVAREFRRVIEDECLRLVKEGIPRERLAAILANEEFDLRQRDYGYADGVALACDALGTWLYDDADEAATRGIEYGPIYEELNRELDGTYFEDLLRELVLESEHRALVELVPVADDAAASREEEAELAAAKAAMNDADLQRIVEDVAALRERQEAEDAPEARATLPRLHVSDIGPARPEPQLVIDKQTPIPCLRHDLPTHQLAYALTYFDLSHLSFAELPYVTVLTRLMNQLATERMTAGELDSYVCANLGFLSFTTEVATQPNWKLANPRLLVSAGALSEKMDALARIPREVWSETVFEDTERMRDVLTQTRIGMEQSFLMNGHSAALARAMSYGSPAAVLAQQLSGVDFYLFLRDLLDNFDDRKEGLCETLRELQARIFTSTGTVASFTGSDEDYRRYWSAAGDLGLSPRTAATKELYVPWPEDKREAFIIPSDVTYLARACDPRTLEIETDGTWSVASNALSYDYLWNEIRVKGGAYGCGFRSPSPRHASFYTYRDPAIDPSLARIEAAGDWLASFDPDAGTFEGFIVSCVSGMDAPLKPYALTKRRNAEYFCKTPSGKRAERRQQMLESTPDALRALAADISRIAREAPACVFAGREAIEASEVDWNVVELMGADEADE